LNALDALAQAAFRSGAYARALRLIGAATSVHAGLGYVPPADVRAQSAATIRASREALGAEAEGVLEAGMAMDLGEAVAFALAETD